MFHDLIIWSKALSIKDVVLYDLNQHFEIYRIFKFHWDKKDFVKNLMVFYSHSQFHLDEEQYIRLLNSKMSHCGIDDFLVIVFEDKNPIMEMRETSSGYALVNVNVFEKKTKFRNLLCGGHKIHTSNDEWETNKDLTVLFGNNLNDFCCTYTKDYHSVDNYCNNCLGTNGFDSISSLFYLFNSSIKYCVLRNFDCLPDQYTTKDHGDIDLLVENLNYVNYLSQAKKVYTSSYRVAHTVLIAGKEVPFDFRYLGDNYLDSEWEENILNTRCFHQNGFYIPNKKNYYYSLLYHAYVQKPKVAKDYIAKLEVLAFSNHESFSPRISDAIASLDAFMKNNKYEYVRPKDNTVLFNLDTLSHSKYAFRHGYFISRNIQGESSTVPYVSIVYEKQHSYYKCGSPFLIENEIRYLLKLSGYDCFPKLLASGEGDEEAWMEITRVEGESVEKFFSHKMNNNPLMVRSFLHGIINVLRILVKEGIIHRDFIGQNMMLKAEGSNCRVSLIDFGWAVKITDRYYCLKPDGLGKYQLKEGYSDFYTLGKEIDYQWRMFKVPYLCKISKRLQSIVSSDYDDTSILLHKIDMLDEIIDSRYSIIDAIEMFAYRHITFGKYLRKARKIIKRLCHIFLKIGVE